MILLDEQIRSRIRFRQIGKDMAAAGIKDENIIPFLLTLKRPTLFTHDHGFFQSSLAHSRYCLVLLAESDIEAAFYIRRFLRHSRFNTIRKRMGPSLVSTAKLSIFCNAIIRICNGPIGHRTDNCARTFSIASLGN